MATERTSNGHGGARSNAGRKPKADEIALIESMDKIAIPVKALEKLWNLAKADDLGALKVWLEYRFGKPKQSVDTNISIDLGKIFPEDV